MIKNTIICLWTIIFAYLKHFTIQDSILIIDNHNFS